MDKVLDCPYKKRCGSCQYIGIPYKTQLSKKNEFMKKLFFKYGKVAPVIGCENPYNYRNKVHMAFDTDKEWNAISGLYEVSTHKIVKVDHCLLDDLVADDIVIKIKELMPKYNLRAYSEVKERGLLRHVLIKRSIDNKQIMVVLVLMRDHFERVDEFTKELVSIFKEIKTVIVNINPAYTSMVLGENERVIYGKGYIEDTLCGLKFRISSKSFYQVNKPQAEVLYTKALDLANITKRDIVLDAYSGTGTIGMIASKNAKKVLSVELSKDACRDALENAKRNNINNISIICDDATKYITKALAKKEIINVVILDPPRTGSTFKFLSSLNKLLPQRIIYISCNPITLKRDLDYLLSLGKYDVKVIQPVDMFPQTDHLETIVKLYKKL